MTPPAPFDEALDRLCERWVHDAETTLGPLLELTADRLIRYSVSITRHQQDAEDSVQSVFVGLASRPGLLGAATKPWAYLLTAVRHESLATVRRSRRLTFFRTLADLTTWLPVDRLDQQESIEEVWRAIRRLPAEQAEVVVLKLWEELTFAEIGDVVGASAETASSRYRYALQKLRRSLHDLCPADVSQPSRPRREVTSR